MSVLSTPNHINEYVLFELLPVSNHEFACFDQAFGGTLTVTRVYSEYRDTEGLDNVGAVFKGATID